MWMYPFFTGVGCPMVIFTEPKLVPVFLEMRKAYESKTIIVSHPWSEFMANRRWGAEFWEAEYGKDAEKAHSPALYRVWYEKKEFILRAIGMKAFGADRFIWCDAGILRYPDWLRLMQHFPLASTIPAGKMTLLRIVPFEESDTEETCFDGKNRIGGGIQAADAETWLWWSGVYDEMLRLYIASNKFCGKDQSIMAACVLRYPQRMNLVVPSPQLNAIEKWFHLLLHFSGVL